MSSPGNKKTSHTPSTTPSISPRTSPSINMKRKMESMKNLQSPTLKHHGNSDIISIEVPRLKEKILEIEKPEITSNLKNDMILMMIQYLQDEGYLTTALTLQSESEQKEKENINKKELIKEIKKEILEGNWIKTEQLLISINLKKHKFILYCIYKQQYLELIEEGKHQKAFTFLMKKLKPLEEYATLPNEFKELSYALTCNSDGANGHSREKLLETLNYYIDFETHDLGGDYSSSLKNLPPKRLITLIEQSLLYQISNNKDNLLIDEKLKIESLLHDFESYIIPNMLTRTFHSFSNIKSIEFLGQNSDFLASGGSDNIINIFNLENGEKINTLYGHESRIWDLNCSKKSKLLASASGDSTIKIWNINTNLFEEKKEKRIKNIQTIKNEEKYDFYSVKIHPDEKHLIGSGYDSIINLYDIETGSLVQNFKGHDSSIASVLFNSYGNLIISGSKDATIKFWDIRSSICLKTFSQHLGEITSLELNKSGSNLLSCSKDNSNRLWDLKLMKPIQKFKGHQNTYKNHVKASFGSNEQIIFGGSEDHFIYAWDVNSGKILKKLSGHKDIVYKAIWNSKKSMLASCSHDKTIKIWKFDAKKE
eukprot:gene1744-513_t